jgi:hypothetical protein
MKSLNLQVTTFCPSSLRSIPSGLVTGVMLQLAMLTEFTCGWIKHGKGRRTINFVKSCIEVSKAIGFFGRHRECLAETRKAKMFLRGTCGLSCWDVVGDAFVVRAAACKESKGGIGMRSGLVSNGRHWREKAWWSGFNGHPWRWGIVKGDLMRRNLDGRWVRKR